MVAEENGFEVIHGIVDSLWLYKKNATKNEYQNLQRKIEHETGFDMSLDIYNWIAFLPSKQNDLIPVPNRYFGAKTNGSIKIRGIESRRRDTPEFLKRCQLEILQLFSSCKTISELKTAAMSEARSIQTKYENELFRYEIPLEQLAFTNKTTKKSTGTYTNNTVQADAVNQLRWEGGQEIVRGQKIRYIISDCHGRRKSKRVIPIQIAEQRKGDDDYVYYDDYDNKNATGIKYDAGCYAELLGEYCCKSILEPIIK